MQASLAAARDRERERERKNAAAIQELAGTEVDARGALAGAETAARTDLNQAMQASLAAARDRERERERKNAAAIQELAGTAEQAGRTVLEGSEVEARAALAAAFKDGKAKIEREQLLGAAEKAMGETVAGEVADRAALEKQFITLRIKEATEALRKETERLKRQLDIEEATQALQKETERLKRQLDIKEATEALRKETERLKRQRDIEEATEALRKDTERLKRQRNIEEATQALRKDTERLKIPPTIETALNADHRIGDLRNSGNEERVGRSGEMPRRRGGVSV